jgi:hypothetical protein
VKTGLAAAKIKLAPKKKRLDDESLLYIPSTLARCHNDSIEVTEKIVGETTLPC